MHAEQMETRGAMAAAWLTWPRDDVHHSSTLRARVIKSAKKWIHFQGPNQLPASVSCPVHAGWQNANRGSTPNCKLQVRRPQAE